MTKFQALFIIFLRCESKCNGTQRFVAGKYKERYALSKSFNYKSTYGGNQIHGINLIEQAEKVLNIKLN